MLEDTGNDKELAAREPDAQPDPAPVESGKPALVYVGPNLGAPLYLKRYQAFVGGRLPTHIEQACGEDQDLARLFVSSHDLARARADLGRPVSLLAKAAAAVDRKRQQRKEG